ncbi:MAG: hypothetical protein MZV49_06615 [Rhodopseudomonas palustris]|nr:hypothetical protein [Rhodopseudomonas palustris]
MNWITMLYGAMAVVASTLAGIYLAARVAQRDDRAYLMCVLLAASMCGVAVMELWMLQARTPEEYALATRLWHVPLWSGICALVGLVHWRLRPRFSWVGWLAAALRTLALVANFSSGSSLHYAVLTGIDHVRLFGEPLSIATGVPNPWMLLGQVSNLLLLIFILDGGVCAWRRRAPTGTVVGAQPPDPRRDRHHPGGARVLGLRSDARHDRAAAAVHGHRDGL